MNVLFSSNFLELVHCSVMSITIFQVLPQRKKRDKYVNNDNNNDGNDNDRNLHNLKVCTVLKESKLCTDNCNCEEFAFYFSMFVS